LIRNFHLVTEFGHFQTNETRNLTHFFFTTWPDYGVPQSAKLFLTFIIKVRERQAEMVKNLGDSWTGQTLGPPIIIHCSAGVGRTGI
jgi:tyrosine-protein phosphatase non-receptor type 9